jgi:hypothetical protein
MVVDEYGGEWHKVTDALFVKADPGYGFWVSIDPNEKRAIYVTADEVRPLCKILKRLSKETN